MTLKEYLDINHLSCRQFAKDFGLNYFTALRWRNRQHMPTPASIRRIEEITGGAVQPADWY